MASFSLSVKGHKIFGAKVTTSADKARAERQAAWDAMSPAERLAEAKRVNALQAAQARKA